MGKTIPKLLAKIGEIVAERLHAEPKKEKLCREEQPEQVRNKGCTP